MLAPADAIGRTHDVRFFDNSLQIAAYDATFGDLAYAKVALDKLSAPIDWILVDGDDPMSAEDGTTGYRHGHTAPGPDVGFYSSLALTSSGDPRIAYFDATAHAVKYASGGFPFATHEIDRGSADGAIEIGPYPAIVMDAYDTPTVAYMAIGLGDGTSGFRTEMRLAKAHDNTPRSHTDWDISVIDTTAISCAGRCGVGTACVVKDMLGTMPNTNPAQSTCLTLSLAPCMPGCSASQACIQNVCKTAVVDTSPATLPAGTGLFAKLLRSPGGALTAIFYDHSLGQLKVATDTGDGKLSPVVIDGKTAGQDVGQFASGSYATDGTLHLAYADAVNGALLYRSISSSGSSSQAEVVDNGIRADGLHPVGASASISAASGSVSILYQDQGASDLVLAEKSGSWTQTPIRAGADGAGFSSHLVDANGARYYTSWILDRAATPLGKLLLDKVP